MRASGYRIEAAGVLGSASRNLPHAEIEMTRHGLGHMCHEGRLIPLTSKRYGSQVG